MRPCLWLAPVAWCLCAVPLAPARVLGAVTLALFLPGWCLWRVVDARWDARRLDLRLALAFIGSGAVTPLALYWGCYGRDLDPLRCATTLAGMCLALGGVGWLLDRRRAASTDGAKAPAPSTARADLALGAVCLLFTLLILSPWATNNQRDGRGPLGHDLVSHSPCSGDWSCHRTIIVSLLTSGIPPRNAILAHQGLYYYYAHFIEAAALVRLSGGAFGVELSLAALAALLAVATCVLLFHLCRDLGASPAVAVAATAITVFGAGLDMLILLLGRATVHPEWWDSGHVGSWATQPRVAFPFANLHWAQHHHAAILLSLALMWHLAGAGVRDRGRSVVAVAFLLAGVMVTSVYVGAVLLGALALIALAPVFRRATRRGARELWLVLSLGGCWALVLSIGMVTEMSHFAPSERSHFALDWPRQPWLLSALTADLHSPRPTGSAAIRGLRARHPALLAPGPPSFYSALVGVLCVPLQFGLVGVLGLLSVRRRGGLAVPWPFYALAASGLVLALFVANFDLQIRASALVWLTLGVLVARTLAGGLPRSWPARVGLLCLGALGLWTLAFDVAGMMRPVWLDGHDVRVMGWVREHTPLRAVVQALPETEPRTAALPRTRYFAYRSYPEFTGRAAVMGDIALAAMHAPQPRLEALERRLRAAFLAPTPAEMARRFRAQGVDYVLWTSNEERYLPAPVRARLLDPRGFQLLYQDGRSFVVRVKTGESR